jgi:hypothetical protein
VLAIADEEPIARWRAAILAAVAAVGDVEPEALSRPDD